MLGNHSVATVSLERLGSRSFTGWYGGWFAKNPSVGLGKMRAMADAREMILEETDGGLHFAVACRVVESSEEPETVNMRRAEWRTNKCKFTIMVSVATDREDKDPVNAAKKLLDEAEAKGVDELRREKDEWYRNFWSNSFVKLGDDYLENIYYLHRYLMSAGSRGEFPLAFNGDFGVGTVMYLIGDTASLEPAAGILGIVCAKRLAADETLSRHLLQDDTVC